MTATIALDVARIAAPGVEWEITRLGAGNEYGEFLAIYAHFPDGACGTINHRPRTWDDAVHIAEVIAVARECQNLALAHMEGALQ